MEKMCECLYGNFLGVNGMLIIIHAVRRKRGLVKNISVMKEIFSTCLGSFYSHKLFLPINSAR